MHYMAKIAKNLNRFTPRSLKPRKLCWSAALAFAALIGGKLPAKAANFNFNFAPGSSLEQMLSFEMAGLYWSNHLADDVTINLFIETTDQLPENVIGGALPGLKSKEKFEHLLKGKKYLEKISPLNLTKLLLTIFRPKETRESFTPIQIVGNLRKKRSNRSTLPERMLKPWG